MGGFNAFYFSFSTLTTVGFGDITPLSKVARTLAVMEAVTGTLYLAILISRLVGMYSPSARTPTSPKIPISHEIQSGKGLRVIPIGTLAGRR